MRTFRAIGAAFLMAWAIPAATYADGMPPANTVSAPGCRCPGIAQRHIWHRHGHHYAWHRRYGFPRQILAVAWPAYNPPITP